MTSTGLRPPAARGARDRRLVPYLMVLPAGLWLLLFFVVPSVQLAATSLYDPAGSLADGYAMTWEFGNYPAAVAGYWPHLLRSLGYAAAATVACLLLGFPLAYAIAVKAGRWRNLLLVAVIAPFFTSFLVRTLAWKTILSDNGVLVSVLRDLHLLGPDGRLLATASTDDTARLWDPATAAPIGQPLTGHTGPVMSVAFSPDGRLLASASTDATTRLWDPATGAPIGQPLTGHTGPVMSVAFSPDGRLLASASRDHTIRLWATLAITP